MSHTSRFLKLQIIGDNSPTQSQIYFERVALAALSECQDQINRYQEKIEGHNSVTNPALRQIDVKHHVRANPETVGCIRVEVYSEEGKEKAISEQLEAGNRLLTFKPCHHPSAAYVTGTALFFIPNGVTEQELADRAMASLIKSQDLTLQNLEKGLKESQEDMRTLKKAVQARQAEIKSFSKCLAEFG